jgi:hypothetical protein
VYHKEIRYDTETRDYAMHLDGELIGFARTHQEAQITLDTLVHELLSGRYAGAASAEQAADAEPLHRAA